MPCAEWLTVEKLSSGEEFASVLNSSTAHEASSRIFIVPCRRNFCPPHQSLPTIIKDLIKKSTMNALLLALACLAVQSVAEYVEREDDGQVYVVRCIFWASAYTSISSFKSSASLSR